MISLLLDWLVQPLSLFAIGLLALLVVFCLSNVSVLVRSLTLGSLLTGLLVFSSPMFANFLVHTLEHSRENPCWCEEGPTDLPVVVLGGGKSDYVNSDSVYDILQTASIRRAAGAVDIAADTTQFYLLGGGRGRLKESELMAQILRDRGISDDRIVQERHSGSTLENASQLAELLSNNQQSKRIALVTSSLHVPRASRTFEKQGFEVCHYATDVRYAKAVAPIGLLPYVGALSKSTQAMHEYLSYFYYWLKQDA